MLKSYGWMAGNVIFIENRDRVNNKSGMGFEAGNYDWGDMWGDTLRPDRGRGHEWS